MAPLTPCDASTGTFGRLAQDFRSVASLMSNLRSNDADIESFLPTFVQMDYEDARAKWVEVRFDGTLGASGTR